MHRTEHRYTALASMRKKDTMLIQRPNRAVSLILPLAFITYQSNQLMSKAAFQNRASNKKHRDTSSGRTRAIRMDQASSVKYLPKCGLLVFASDQSLTLLLHPFHCPKPAPEDLVHLTKNPVHICIYHWFSESLKPPVNRCTRHRNSHLSETGYSRVASPSPACAQRWG